MKPSTQYVELAATYRFSGFHDVHACVLEPLDVVFRVVHELVGLQVGRTEELRTVSACIVLIIKLLLYIVFRDQILIARRTLNIVLRDHTH